MSHVEPTCPHCQATLPDPALGESGAVFCPQCGRRLAPAKGRSARSALIAASALIVTAVAVVLVYPSIRVELDEAANRRAAMPAVKLSPPPSKPGPDGLDSSALRSRLVVIRGGKAREDRPIVALGTPSGSNDPNELKGTEHSMLARELIRQAILLAARDELGLATRDEMLGDLLPADQGSAVAEVVTLQRGETLNQALVRRGDGEKAETLLKHELVPPGTNFDSLAKFAVIAETLSRTEFPKVLKGLGLAGKPNAVGDAANLPRGVADRLAQLDYIDIFGAVRDLHAVIRSDGESPARLGALVRGYALLGVLTEFHWHPAHKAFKARSMLYAQRLVARDPKAPWGLWHRAFAEALAGLHASALNDLAEAKKLAEARDVPKPPDWVDLIDAFVRYDREHLKVESGPHVKLAALLRLFVVEFPSRTSVALKAAREVVALDPLCFRAQEAMWRASGVSNLHVVTVIGPQALDERAPAKLKALAGLPESVRAPVDRQAGEVAVLDALFRAGAMGEDAGEPSWDVLGQLIRETRFQMVFHRLYFMRWIWSVPVDAYWNENYLFIAKHRFRPYLESMVLAPQEGGQVLAEFARGLDITNLEINALPMHQALQPFPTPVRWTYGFAYGNSDLAAHDQAFHLENCTEDRKLETARLLILTSPYSPLAMATLIDKDWAGSEPKLAEWDKRAGDSLPMLGALIRRYTRLGWHKEAQRVLSRYIEQSPDAWAYEALARDYKAQDDLAHWQETLDAFLREGEDAGLDKARVCVELANHFMQQKKWTEAQPYAESAAQTWAQWAMDRARACYEGMEDWEQGELWARREAERYPSTCWTYWIAFCKRTGHGETEAARAWTEQFLDAIGDQPDIASAATIGYFHWLCGSPKPARESFRKSAEQHEKTTEAIGDKLALAMLADELDERTERDEILKDLCTNDRDGAPRTIEVLGIFREALARGEKGALDLAAVDRVIDSTLADGQGNIQFSVGMFLKKHGRPNDARLYLQRSADSPTTYGWLQLIARDTLRGLKGGPEPSP